MSDDGEQLFRIAQFEVPGRIDVPDGRWVVRGHANRPEAVVVVQTTQRPRRQLGRRRKDPFEGKSVPATRLSVIDAEPLATDTPDRWLRAQTADLATKRALTIVRRLSHLRSIAAADPEPRPLRPEDLSLLVVGYGTGEQAAAGETTESRELLPPGERSEGIRRSGRGVGPEERLAELLSGRDAVLAAELLTARAEGDLVDGRTREAALQLRVALEAAISELEPWRSIPELDPLLLALREDREDAARIAGAAVRGGLTDEDVDVLTEIVGRLARALRRRTVGRRHGERIVG